MNPAADFLILALTFIGFGALSLSMDRHAKQISSAPPAPRARRLHLISGWLLLTLALYPAIDAYGVSIGISVWIGFLAVSATAVALLLSYLPGMLRPLFSSASILTVIALTLVLL
jgi:hypothetical protein